MMDRGTARYREPDWQRNASTLYSVVSGEKEKRDKVNVLVNFNILLYSASDGQIL